MTTNPTLPPADGGDDYDDLSEKLPLPAGTRRKPPHPSEPNEPRSAFDDAEQDSAARSRRSRRRRPPLPTAADEGDDESPAEEQPPFEIIDPPDVPVAPLPSRRRRRPAPDVAAPEYAEYSAPVRRGGGCADMITAIFLLLTVGVIAYTILLIANPRSPLNPLPVATYPPILVLATFPPTLTPTASFTPEPPTPTIPTATPTETPTIPPTATPTVTNTPVVGGGATDEPPATESSATLALPPTVTPRFTPAPFPFTVGAIRYQPHSGTEACRWQSIAGVILNLDGQPFNVGSKPLAVRITSVQPRIDTIEVVGKTATLGDGSFNTFVNPIPIVEDYTVQLIGSTGAPISDKVSVQTRSGCDENVTVIEFQQNQPY
ncbi:MAG TPA: hypothetical protein PLD47_03490 [Aggregatilineales bacterium]|nr:hypothetical protein [Aggregatilineales bacterium]